MYVNIIPMFHVRKITFSEDVIAFYINIYLNILIALILIFYDI